MKKYFSILLFINITILSAQESHTYSHRENQWETWLKPDGGSPFKSSSIWDHNVGLASLSGGGSGELRSINYWTWTYDDIPTEANIQSVNIKFKTWYSTSTDFVFSIHAIPYKKDESGINFYLECDDDSKVDVATISNVSGYYIVDRSFGIGDALLDSIQAAVSSGRYYFTLGIKWANPNYMPLYYWTLYSIDGGFSSNIPVIDLTINYTTQDQYYTFVNNIEGTQNYGNLIVDNDRQNPIASNSTPINFSFNTSHLVRTDELPFIINWAGVGKTEKFHRYYPNQSDYSLNHQFIAYPATPSIQEAEFQETKTTTIKTYLIDDGSYGNGIIDFRDPWKYESEVIGFWTQTNEYNSYSTPFSIQNNTTNSYGGIFLNQPIEVNRPYYSVSAPPIQQINSKNSYFVNWTGSNAVLENSINNESGVVFNADNSQILANYKAQHITNNSNGFSNSGQRKTLRTPDGIIHLVYESGGKIWYEAGVENGVGGFTWELANNNQPISNAEAKSPSLANYGNIVLIAFQEKTGVNNYKVIVNTYSTQFALNRSEVTTELSSYNDDANPVVACNDNGRVVIVWKQSSGTQGLYYNCATLTSGYQFGAPTISGMLPGTDANSIFPSIDANKFIHNTVYWYFPLVYSHNNDIYLSYIYYKNGVGWSAPSASNISSGSGFTQNYSPSIISWGTNGARVAWIGKRWERTGGMDKRQAEEDGAWIMKTLFKDPSVSGTFYSFEYSVNSVQVQKNIASNGTEDGYLIGWSASYGTNNRYVKNTSFNPTRVFGINGEDVQIIGGNSFNNMYGSFLNYSNPLFKIERSSSISTLGKVDLQHSFNGREGNVSLNDAEMFFTLGDIQVDGETIEFKEKHDTLDIDSESLLNEYLTTNPFVLTNSSNFQYSIQYGFTDSVAIANVLSENGSISFKVELIDDATGQVIGSFDEITYTPVNLYQYNKTGYVVNTEGIGTKTVRLRLVVNSNIEGSQYALNNAVSSESVVLLGKQYSKKKTVSYKGTLAVDDYALDQNYPNPFNPITTISYALPQDGLVILKIYDALGREVSTLVNEFKQTGRYAASFDASKLSSGVYIYKLTSGKYTATKKMMLIK
ncbi:MAG: T9SS type A sorting domain-containing protein [Bacteroidota bacterium]